jgi:inosine-uridine nucleoside N-ribohydrolase
MSDRPLPTLLDTDIGGDIDDTWALGFMLCCPEIDLRMVVTDTGNTDYRTRVAAKFLALCGRSDIPVGVGIHQSDDEQGQKAWVSGYSLDDYPGTVHRDGVAGLVRFIMDSPEPLRLVCIGPVPNIAAALQAEPRIAGKCHFVGMHGSIHSGMAGSPDPIAEWNVVCDALACRAVFEAPWLSRTITPLDTCSHVKLTGDLYAQIRDSQALVPRLIMENYRAWATDVDWVDAEVESSTLFDTVAAWMVFSHQWLKFETLPIHVTDDGFTRVQEGAPLVDCAVNWDGLDAYEAELVRRLTTLGPGC